MVKKQSKAPNKFRSLMLQLAITITVFIVLIEGILLVVSYHGKEKELNALNETLRESIEARYDQVIPNPLEQSYIDKRLQDYTRNIILLTLLIIITVVIGSLAVFYFIAGKHINALTEFNRKFDSANPEAFPEEDIPKNDLGRLIHSQNKVINDFAASLMRLREAKSSLKDMSSFSLYNPDPVFRIDKNGVITLANPAALKAFHGMNLIGGRINDIVSDLDFSDIEYLLHQGGVFQHTVEHKDKAYIFQFTGVVNLQSINVYSLDVTEEKKLREQVYESSKLASIGELAAGVGHEINNPLAIVSGNMDLLEDSFERKYLDAEIMKKVLGGVSKAVQRMSSIVNSLRTYSRTDSEEEVINVHSAIQESLNLVQKIYAASGVKIEQRLEASETDFVAKPGRFQQVLVNLLNNAKDATEKRKQPKIIIKTQNTDEFIKISVSDNGCGIPKNTLNKIFGSFYTTKERGKGTGLGLSIVRSIVGEMGGEIKVTSELGFGTTFTVLIPISEQQEKKPSNVMEASEYKETPKSHRVLIVDDEPEVCEFLSRVLRSMSFDVVVCEDGQQALEHVLGDEPFDLIFCDLKMPVMDGEELLSELQNRLDIMPLFIFLTGAEVVECKGEYDGVLLKPFQRDDILNLIHGLQEAHLKLSA